MMLCHLVSALGTANKCPFRGVWIVPCFSHLSAFCWCFCFKNTPKHSAEVLPSVSKNKKVVIGLMEIIRVFAKLHSGVSYGAIGSEFNVNDSTV